MANPVVIKCEAAFGANLANAPGTWTWTDITADFRAQAGVSIRTGRADEDQQSTPAAAPFGLNDATGKYVPRNVLGLNWPNIRQNTPFRLTFASGVRTIVFADSWSPSWADSLTIPVVSVSASGVLRRLGQGRDQTLSAMRRRIQALTPVAYWPLEDGDSNTSGAGSALSDGSPMVAASGWTFGNNSSPVGGVASVLRTSATSILYGRLPAQAPLSVRVDISVFQNSADVNQSTLTLHTTNNFGQLTFALGGLTANTWHHHRIEYFSNAGIATWDWYVDGVQTTFAQTIGATWFPVIALTVDVDNPGGNSDAIAHVAAFSPRISSDTYQAFLGYPNESPTTRLSRLCADANIPITVTGTSNTILAAQRASTFIELLRSCENADGGILADGSSNAGLTYLARASRYNLSAALTLDNAQNQLALPFQPIEDDQRRRNDWTVTRNGGSSGRFVDTSGAQGTAAVGLYSDTITLDVAGDGVLVDQASWRVHLGTVDRMRYPTVTLNLRANPALVTAWLATTIGSRLTLKNLPTQHGPGDIDLIVEGWSEFSDGLEWLVTINAGAYDPWRAYEVADTALGHLDTSGSSLSSAAAVGASSLSVATTTGPLWTRVAGDFPFTVSIAGIPVTVTNITGAASPQTFTVTSSTVIKALPINSTVNLWKPGVIGL